MSEASRIRPKATKPSAAAAEKSAVSARKRLADRDLTILPPPEDPDPFEPYVAGVEYGVLDGLMGYSVRRAQIAVTTDFVRSLAPWNITPPRFAAMVLIGHNANLKLTHLAQIMGIARSGAVMLVDTLEELGYVERRPSADDRRAFSLRLTPEGRNTLDAITRAVKAHDERVTMGLTLEEREQLKRLLVRLSLCAR